MNMLTGFRTGAKGTTPFIAQSEASECALACLAMIAGHHGYRTDLNALRKRFGISLKGATLKFVLQVAEEIGFQARPLRSEIEGISDVALPAILHWDLNHFVVLERISSGLRGQRYCIHDPARGSMAISRAEFSRHFTGVLIELSKSIRFKAKVDKVNFGITQLWSAITGFWRAIGQIFILSLVMQLISLAMPFYLQIAIDSVVPGFDHDLLLLLAFGFSGLSFVNFSANWLRGILLVALNNSLSYQVVVNLFRHLMHLPLSWFARRHVGDIVSRFGSTQAIAQTLSQGLLASCIDGMLALTTVILMFLYSPRLALLAITALVAYILIRLVFVQALRVRNVDVINSAARENSVFIESIRGFQAIKSFGQESNRQRIWQRAKAESINAQVKLGRMSAGFDAFSQLALTLERVAFVYFAISLALDSRITIGMLFAFQAYKQQFLDASMRLVEQAMNFKVMQVHLGRVSDIALSRREDEDGVSNGIVKKLNGEVELRNVCYRYGGGDPEILSRIDLKIRSGEIVALVGPSGGGKTTLVKVMMGLLKPTSGDVIIDGQSMAHVGYSGFRHRIGSVAQDDSLFAGSLGENIAFFDPEIDPEKVERAARLARVHDEIIRMPLRYDTLVGDMGSVLSGGQKQRVLLARALYAKPDILFIDEGTAHLDPQSEAQVLRELSGLNVTIIMIAHRTQSIQAADRVIIVCSGGVKELDQKHLFDEPEILSQQ